MQIPDSNKKAYISIGLFYICMFGLKTSFKTTVFYLTSIFPSTQFKALLKSNFLKPLNSPGTT